MGAEIKLPKLGEDTDKGVVLSVLVSKGDEIEEGQSIVELETDKATTEVPADAGGTVSAVEVSEGDEIGEGTVLVRLSDEEGGEGTDDGEAAAEEESGDGEREKTDDGADDTPAQERGEEDEEETAAEEDEEGPEDEAADDEADSSEDRGVETLQDRDDGVTERQPRSAGHALASPSTRGLARKLGLDLSQVPGTGTGGRITEDDVLAFVRQRLDQVSGPDRQDAGPVLPDASKWGPISEQSMSAVRAATAESVARSWKQIPLVSHFDEADMTTIDTQLSKRDDVGLTPVIVKLAARAMRAFPQMNTMVDYPRKMLIQRDYVHVGVAVDTEAGLLVPVLRDVDDLSLPEVASGLYDLVARARQRKISGDELVGASVMVTNVGTLGTTWFTPLVQWPQVCALGVGRAFERVRLDEDDRPRTHRILPLTVSYDHRAVDGADAARFLRWIAESLEDPLNLL